MADGDQGIRIFQQYVFKLEKPPFIPPKTLESAANILAVLVEAILRFDENTLLLLAAEAKPEELTSSIKEVIDHFKEARADRQGKSPLLV